ncbi:MAG: PHP domain-containing protein [Balneolaceae bacterium]
MAKADLHTHTTASDGFCSPKQLIELAASRSLNSLAITDHDTIQGYLDARPFAEEHQIRLLPGVEVSTRWEGREVHLLGYSFEPDNEPLVQLLRLQRKARRERVKQILDQLRKKGVEITMDEVVAESNGGTIGRPHVAEVLIRKRIVSSFPEAFIRYLGSNILEKLEAGYAEITDVIRVIREAGGATSLAHPGRMYSRNETEGLLELGLDGIECIHPSHHYDQQKQYLELAERENLLITGGSDFHGKHDGYTPYFGIVTLSDSRVNELARMARRRSILLHEE